MKIKSFEYSTFKSVYNKLEFITFSLTGENSRVKYSTSGHFIFYGKFGNTFRISREIGPAIILENGKEENWNIGKLI